jgi:hypothetical protein
MQKIKTCYADALEAAKGLLKRFTNKQDDDDIFNHPFAIF